MTEDIIDRLSRNVKPVRSLNAHTLWAWAAAAVIAAAVYIFFLYGPRSSLTALLGGDMGVDRMTWMKPLLFLVIGAGALWSVADLARPEGRLRLRTLVPLIAVIGIVLGRLVADIAGQGVAALGYIGNPSLLCVVTVLCGGMAGLIIMWRFWLRRAATSHPELLGAMSGLAAASLTAAAYALHCDSDAPVYILGIYGGAVAAVTALAAFLGRRLLRW